MAEEHDFKANPELFDSQMSELYFRSPHKQIFEDFNCTCVKVHDGDSITVNWNERDFNFPLRFAKIDTKELSEGGKEAKEWLKERIEGKNINVEIDKDNRVGKFRRIIGTVIHNGINVNEELVREGLAIPFGQKNEGEIINPVRNIESVIKWP